MDMNRDEVRRQMKESERAQAEALPRWSEALDRTIDAPHGDGPMSALLSAPNRRGFLRLGGLTVAGAALIAACTPEPQKVQIAQTGDTPSTPTTQLYDPHGDITTDTVLLRVAQSIEKLAITAYDAVLGASLLPQAATDMAKLFRSHHNDHFSLLAEKVSALGGDNYNDPNPVLREAVLDPVTKAITAGTATAKLLVELAFDLEDAAAQTYTNAVTDLTTPDLRHALMSIGGVEARHVAVLLGIRSPGNPLLQVPFAFEKTANAVKPGSDAAVKVGPGRAVTSTTAAPRQPATGATAPSATTPSARGTAAAATAATTVTTV